MTLFERVSGWFSRNDAGPPLALPGPTALELAEPVARGRRADSVYNRLSGLGGPGDKGASARPSPFLFPLSEQELQNLYAANGIARRIVDLLPGRATRRGWSSPDIPESEYQRLRAWARVRDGMRMAGLYGDALVLLVTQDDVPRQFRRNPREWLAQPLDMQRIGKLHALQVFDAWEARPQAWESSLASPGYRMPSLWSLSASDFSATVHASRVIVFRGSRRPPSQLRGGWGGGMMPDASVLQHVWDEIQRLTSTMQAGATIAQELREGVLTVGDLESKLASDESGGLLARFSLMSKLKGILGYTIIGEKDKYENRGNPPTGFKELSEGAQMMLSLVLGWPRTMLTGEAPSGLGTTDASGEERERQIVSDYQETHREELEYLDSVIYSAQDGPTGGKLPDPEERRLVFAPLDEPKEAAVAALRKTMAEVDAIYIGTGVLAPADVTASRFGESGWQFEMEPVEPPDPEEEEALALAQAEIEAEARAAAGGDDGTAGEGRGDAAGDGCCILVPAADPGLLQAVEAAIGQRLIAETEPHVTVLFLGTVDSAALPEVVAAVTAAASEQVPMVLERGTVRAFPHGPYGTPIVVELESWALDTLNGRLLRALAHVCVAKQFPRFRPHLTIGYAPEPLDADAMGRLLSVSAEAVRVPVAALHVVNGADVVAAVAVSG